MNTLLTVTVRDRQGIQFEGQAKAVSSTNSSGPFDILPEHTHFISLITTELIIHLVTNEKKSFNVTRGMLSAVDNTITVLLGITPEQNQASDTLIS